MKQHIIILIFVFVIAILWYSNKSREGFQTDKPISSSLSSPDQVTSDTCVLMKNLYEQIKARYVTAQKDNNPYVTDMLSASISEMEKNIKNMGCS
jgi:hypothetical protein